jgi:hypothetical protein
MASSRSSRLLCASILDKGNNGFNKKRAVQTSRAGTVPSLVSLMMDHDGARLFRVRLNRDLDCGRALGARRVGLISQLSER